MRTSKTTLTVLLLSLFSSTLYSQELLNFTVKGKVTHNFDEYIYLSYAAKVDSFLVKDNRFEFEGQVPNRLEAKVHTKGGYVTDSFYLTMAPQPFQSLSKTKSPASNLSKETKPMKL